MNFVNSMAFTAITFVAFTALVALISWWKTRGDNLDTQDGYYLGGRSLTGPVIAGSLLMTNLSAEQLVGNNGQAVRVGMSTMGWEVTSAIALVILAFVLMPKYLKTGLTTVPQFFEQRYDEGTRRLVSIIVLPSYVVIMLPNILYAGAQVFVNIFGIDEMFGISRFAASQLKCRKNPRRTYGWPPVKTARHRRTGHGGKRRPARRQRCAADAPSPRRLPPGGTPLPACWGPNPALSSPRKSRSDLAVSP